ncbi:MAG: glycosyltransferase family 2 protein [Candidatus Omnitrophica bacterium]|nr:glycosyltransferase family 2 protein [Candidatus Omnitrophota bacterium]
MVIPALNEEGNIPRLEREVMEVAGRLPYDFEFLVVDNASTDRTGELVKDICRRDSRWKYIRFSRNFTGEMSMTAGYRFASGDAIIVLYSDLQDPPDVMPRLIEKWLEGYDIVYGVRTARPGDPAWRNLAVKAAYRLIRYFSDVPIPENAGDFRLVTRQVRDALLRCDERNRYLRGLIAWLGFRQIGVPYERRPRQTGVSKAPFWDLFYFVFNAISSFSLKPLRIFTFMGFGLLLASILACVFYLYLALHGTAPQGIPTVILLLVAAIGLNSLGVGILGEYVGRTYSEVKQRPLFLVSEAVNIQIPKE